MKNQTNNTATAVDHQPLVLPLRVIDVGSPFFFGVGRDMTDEERENAERHGRYDNPPMSVLGVTREGLAAVEGKDMAEMFAASPRLLDLAEKLAAWDKRWPKWSDSNGTSEKEMNALCEEAHAILESLGQNDQGHAIRTGSATPPTPNPNESP